MAVSERIRGFAAMVAASLIWGLLGVFFKLIDHIPPGEVLAHRFVWSFVMFAAILAVVGRIGEMRALLLASPRQFISLAAGALAVSINWGLFIYAVQIERATEASFGYFIFPLVAVLAGAIVFRERLLPSQWSSVALAAAAVILLAFGLGAPPWISLTLAISFTCYGVIKKHMGLPATASVACEALIFSPPALIWLIHVHARSEGHFGADPFDTVMLILLGAVSAGPLILMSYAANRIPYTEVGLIQYVNPTVQFLVARFAFREPFSVWHAIAFPVIWIALAIYSVTLIRSARSDRKPPINPSTLSSTEKTPSIS